MWLSAFDDKLLGVQAGVQSGDLATALVGTINVLGTAVAASLMDKFGRKQLLSLSFTGMATSMLAMSAGDPPLPLTLTSNPQLAQTSDALYSQRQQCQSASQHAETWMGWHDNQQGLNVFEALLRGC